MNKQKDEEGNVVHGNVVRSYHLVSTPTFVTFLCP